MDKGNRRAGIELLSWHETCTLILYGKPYPTPALLAGLFVDSCEMPTTCCKSCNAQICLIVEAVKYRNETTCGHFIRHSRIYQYLDLVDHFSNILDIYIPP